MVSTLGDLSARAALADAEALLAGQAGTLILPMG
jgi:hypothetical protein